MRSGDLDRRITIERASVVVDPFGGEMLTWATLATVWADVEWISDGERFRGAEVTASITTRFRIRWGSDVKVTDRVIYDGRTFDILGVKEWGRHEGQELTASARAEG